MAIEAILIDLDGTLVDTVEDLRAAVNIVLRQLGLAPLSADQTRAAIGKGVEHLLKTALALAGGRADLAASAMDHFHDAYGQTNGKFSRLYPGVELGLEATTAAGFKLACVTNKPLRFAQALLECKGLGKYFQYVGGGDKSEHRKPNPQPLLLACTALNVTPAQALMVGDSAHDVAAARAACCQVVLVPYGYNHGLPAAQSGADAVVDSLAQVVEWIGYREMGRE